MSSTLRMGASGAAVGEVRQLLGQLGLLPDHDLDGALAALRDPDSAVYDDAVDRAVRAFQQQRGLTVDGIVGAATYRALDEARWQLGNRILTRSISHPVVGDDVAALQRRLLEMGFDCGRVDGVFGPDTERGLREFQRNVGLVVDGTCGPETLAALERLSRTVVGGRPSALRDDERLARRGPALRGKVVVIDPGHGGDDRGIVAHGLEEAAIVEDLAARIEGRLVATGVDTYLSRGPAMEIDESGRADWANSLHADLVVSLHIDAHANPEAHGVATYYYGSDSHGHVSAIGERFADLVQREIVSRTGLRNCRTHAKTWDLLRNTRMAAVRVEAGYLTNSGDAARLGDPAFRDALADAVVIAVQRLYLAPANDPVTGTLHLSQLVAL